MIKILTFILVMFFTTSVQALELLMYHNKLCGYCQAFMKEVKVDYQYDLPEKFLAKNLELVIIEQGNEPEWFVMAYIENRIKPIRGTPTFIIWNGRKELTRIIGYSTKQKFYNKLDEIFKE